MSGVETKKEKERKVREKGKRRSFERTFGEDVSVWFVNIRYALRKGKG